MQVFDYQNDAKAFEAGGAPSSKQWQLLVQFTVLCVVKEIILDP